MTKDPTQRKQVPTEVEVDALCGSPAEEFDALVAVTFSDDGRIPPPRDLEDVAAEQAMCDELADRLVSEAIQADWRAAECR